MAQNWCVVLRLCNDRSTMQPVESRRAPARRALERRRGRGTSHRGGHSHEAIVNTAGHLALAAEAVMSMSFDQLTQDAREIIAEARRPEQTADFTVKASSQLW